MQVGEGQAAIAGTFLGQIGQFVTGVFPGRGFSRCRRGLVDAGAVVGERHIQIIEFEVVEVAQVVGATLRGGVAIVVAGGRFGAVQRGQLVIGEGHVAVVFEIVLEGERQAVVFIVAGAAFTHTKCPSQ